MTTVTMRTDDAAFLETVVPDHDGLSYRAYSVDSLLRWAFAVRENQLSGNCTLSVNPDEARVHRLRIPEQMTEAAWVIGCAGRSVRPRLKSFIFGYYSHRPGDRNSLVRILAGKILQDPEIGPDHRAWKVLHAAVNEHAHPDSPRERSPSALSERRISRETGWSRHAAVKSSAQIEILLDSWKDECEETLGPIFLGRGWLIERRL